MLTISEHRSSDRLQFERLTVFLLFYREFEEKKTDLTGLEKRLFFLRIFVAPKEILAKNQVDIFSQSQKKPKYFPSIFSIFRLNRNVCLPIFNNCTAEKKM